MSSCRATNANDKPTASACRREALRSVTPTMLRDQHHRILAALRDAPAGLTDEEIQAVTGVSPNAERPRRGELVASGLVEESGERRRTKSGRAAAVWVVA